MAYIRDTYGVPAKRGMRVRFTGGTVACEGRITSARGGHIRAIFDGDKRPRYLHPTWCVEYLTAEPPNNPDTTPKGTSK